jgi:glyoxylase I family protein
MDRVTADGTATWHARLQVGNDDSEHRLNGARGIVDQLHTAVAEVPLVDFSHRVQIGRAAEEPGIPEAIGCSNRDSESNQRLGRGTPANDHIRTVSHEALCQKGSRPMTETNPSSTPSPRGSGAGAQALINSVHGIRYQVTDVSRAVAFYSQHLGFKIGHQQLPAFASVSLGDTTILLSGPGASGSRPMPDGQRQESGGWNRVVLRVTDLPACISALRGAGVRFRNEMETGPGGRQILIEDPDGNPIELFEPASQPARP